MTGFSDSAPTQVDNLVISLRAYADGPLQEALRTGTGNTRLTNPRRPPIGSSSWTLVFDTETTTDSGQSLRFGSYQVYDGDKQYEAGLFFKPEALTAVEQELLADYATAHGLELLTRDAFVERVFFDIGYELRATIVGFHLPFDISRLAISHGSARGNMRGGFTFKLSADKRRPAVQIKHLSQRTALIRFAAPFRQRLARSERKRGDYVPVRRGFFVDTRTLAGALLSRSFNLASLSSFLGIEHLKVATAEHGQALSWEYVDYALRDVQATCECYRELVRRYSILNLQDTPPPLVFSEASIGKGYLKAMGVRPWREVQPAVPSDILAKIMGSYFGGRCEVRIRRELRQVVLCDFLSMYPTVCTLMKLWPFVIADGMKWRDGTADIGALLDTVTLDDLQKLGSWPKLTALVQVLPNDDILPVRARYAQEPQATIGANYLRSDEPLWFTLADCIVSKIQTGISPKVVQVLIFEPGKPQSNLRAVDIGGNTGYRVDPIADDFYKRLIELRHDVKDRRDKGAGASIEALDAEQNALKIAANATSYGVFVEVNVKERAQRKDVTVYSATEEPFSVRTNKDEEPGRFFHPLLATLITGAARLMLAVSEHLVEAEGLEWVFCDTDSMAIAKPTAMPDAEFYERVDRIVAWFAALNPYDFGGTIFRVEDINFGLEDSGLQEPLYCWAVSSKRYALFNINDDGRPKLRKASAHGLGHLRPPYEASNPAPGIPEPAVASEKLGVERWQHDLWWQMVSAALAGHPDQVHLNFHPALTRSAISRYAATSPRLLRWFDRFNANLSYDPQVKPFGFLMTLYASALGEVGESSNTFGNRCNRRPKPVAAFDKDIQNVSRNAFDRDTGAPVPPEKLMTFKQALAQYHLHPESKFLNGDYRDRGTTRRRHVQVMGVRHIGKEANRWEEQAIVGLDESAVIDYGLAAPSISLDRLGAAICRHSVRAIAKESGISRGRLTRLLRGKLAPTATVLERLNTAIDRLDRAPPQRGQLDFRKLEN